MSVSKSNAASFIFSIGTYHCFFKLWISQSICSWLVLKGPLNMKNMYTRITFSAHYDEQVRTEIDWENSRFTSFISPLTSDDKHNHLYYLFWFAVWFSECIWLNLHKLNALECKSTCWNVTSCEYLKCFCLWSICSCYSCICVFCELSGCYKSSDIVIQILINIQVNCGFLSMKLEKK